MRGDRALETDVGPPDENPLTPPPSPQSIRTGASVKARSRFLPVLVLAIAVVAGLVAWLVVSLQGSKTSSTTTTVASAKNLETLVASLHKTVYWVGPWAGTRYELDRRSNGQILLRYLSGKTEVGTAATLTVGTYAMKNAYNATVALGKRKGWDKLETGTGGVAAFINTSRPRSVFFAVKGANYQVEVYDPTAGRAAALVQEGRALLVTQGERLGLTLSGLKKKVASLGQPVYWVGPKSGVTYEYTRSPNGDTYVRYIPEGAAIGSISAYPSVGTYPLANATAVTRAAAKQSGATSVKLRGAVAFYTKSTPASIYVAFKGSEYQIEVYDPSSGKALAAVRAGKLVPIG
jgi:hypothetical protein